MIQEEPFGCTREGTPVTAYRLENENGMRVRILDYGCTVQSVQIPDRNGKPVDVVLGYDTVPEYQQQDGYMGACVGRVGNRIGKGAFTLEGKAFSLACNDRGNHLHGGRVGFDRRLWRGEIVSGGVRFARRSADGEEGYPGNLDVRVTYTLSDANVLRIDYSAVSDQKTLVNLTNHSYFNLNGGGTVLQHLLQIPADRFCENDANCLPTGRLLPVAGTPFDFRTPKPIGRDIGCRDAQLGCGGGYDHNFCLSGARGMHPAAALYAPESGISLEVQTTLPGVQLYTGNSLTPRTGKGGRKYSFRDAVCLETQLWPDAVHHADFPSAVLEPGVCWQQATEYRFGVR